MHGTVLTHAIAAAAALGFASTPMSVAEIIISTEDPILVGGRVFQPGQLSRLESCTAEFSLLFDHANFAAEEDIDAVSLLSATRIVLSTKSEATLSGERFLDGDLIVYDTVTESVSRLFDEDLFTDDEDVDAVFVRANGRIVLSTTSDAELGGTAFTDGDIVEFDPSTGRTTILLAESLFTGDVDVDAVDVQDDGVIALSTKSAATLGGLAFDDADVVAYDPSTGQATLLLDGSMFKLKSSPGDVDVNAFAIWESRCPADVDGNGVVGRPDLDALLEVWGPCPGCPEDVDRSCDVAFEDVLAVLNAWGDCD